MKRVLLLIHDETDVSALQFAAKALIAAGTQKIWMLHSPAIVIDQDTAAAKFDGEISALQAAENAAAKRGDYEAAKDYKTKREANILERGKALRDAWREVPQEQRKARVADLSKAFRDEFGTRQIAINMQIHSDHYDRTEQPALLNSLKALLPPGFEFGNFAVLTPAALHDSTSAPVPVSQKAESNGTKPAPSKKPVSREEELKAMRYLSLKSEAKKAGIEVEKGMKMEAIVAAILAKEQSAAAA